MEADSSSPLVAEHLPRNHPVVTRDYSLFTPAISEMVDTVGRWIDDQVDGATIFGPSRFGKSSAVDHWLQALLSQRCGGHVPMVVWSHTDSGGAASVGAALPGTLTAVALSPQAREDPTSATIAASRRR